MRVPVHDDGSEDDLFFRYDRKDLASDDDHRSRKVVRCRGLLFGNPHGNVHYSAPEEESIHATMR